LYFFNSECWIVRAASDARPNFVVILTDDMGYSDIGCYGSEIETPNIDRLASDGVRFTQFYNCSRCTSTRASLLTGAYPHRVGMREFGRTMDKNVPTVPENLRDSGYSTAMVGKWHLSELPAEPRGGERILWMNHELGLDRPFADVDSYPLRRGFEKFYGVVWGVVNHFDPFSLMDENQPVKEVPADYYMTDAITDRSIKYIRKLSQADKPFFMYVAYTAPHWPIQARPEDIAKYKNRYKAGWEELRRERFERQQELGLFAEDVPLGEISGEARSWESLSPKQQEYQATKMAVHAAMIDRVDQGVGQIIKQLRDSGQLENTVVMFFSDNGASPEIPGPPGYDRYSGTRDGREVLREKALRRGENYQKLGTDESYAGIGPSWASASNTPLRYWKMESYEGGCRTPMVVHWPAGLKANKGSLVDDVAHVIDIAPTLYELADAEPHAASLRDGVSLTPVLQGDSIPKNRQLYFDHQAGGGVRDGDWKASRLGYDDWELFNLANDPGETQDLSEAEPETLRRLIESWNTWRVDVSQSPTKQVSHRDSKVTAID
jgi:arylsulfatase